MHQWARNAHDINRLILVLDEALSSFFSRCASLRQSGQKSFVPDHNDFVFWDVGTKGNSPQQYGIFGWFGKHSSPNGANGGYFDRAIAFAESSCGRHL
jgi:hypothetical protein